MDTGRPRVSALITVYNGQDHIADAVESLLAQSLRDIEVLVIDDGSEDETASVLQRFQDPRLKVVRKERMGRASALAYGCEIARGEFIAILDADDRAYPERLAKQTSFLESNEEYAWVGCAEERLDSRRAEHVTRVYAQDDGEVRRQAAKCIPYSHSGVMFRRCLIDNGINYDPHQRYLIDFEFFLRVARAHRVANLDEVLVKRNIDADSYFQRTFSTARQNRRLALLCARAIRDLRLPFWFYAYPALRLIYPVLPNSMKRLVRKTQGLKESSG